jgi:Acyl-CoA oxidase.
MQHCKVTGQPTDNSNLFVLFSVLLAAYKWLVCWLLQATANKIKSQHQLGKDAFSAKNDTQTFFAKTLSLAFIEVSY